MHIPQGASQTIDILSFDEALSLSGRGDEYDSKKWLYVPDFYTEYRYILGTRGRDPLICIGINPSTAEPDNLDNTLKSVARIAEGNGFDSWIMFNVYAQRATRPDDMDRELNRRLHEANMRAFEYILQNVATGLRPAIWAAWGTIIEKRPYLPDCVRDMVELGRRYNGRWLCAGKRSVKGHPHHPLYLRKDEKTVDFDIEAYLEGNEMIKLAVCQLRTELSQTETMEKARRMVSEAAANGAEIVVLPEMFNCPYSGEYFKKYAALGHREAVKAMSAWAKELGILLVGGSIPETEDGRIYNTCFVFDKQGRQIARHRKVHLFDVDLPGMRFKESNTFSPGEDITVFDTEYGKMGCAVCFDVRFPELFRAMAVRGAKVIFLPAQFNMKTGPAHWDLSLRARAVDNEVFMVGASAARYEGFDYLCWGHSAVVDPFGEVLVQADEKEQIIYTDIDLARVDEVRDSLPTFKRLRREIYSVAE